MQTYTSYKSAFHACMKTQTFSIAHLYKLKKPMTIDTSGCYKIFFPLSGDKKFHIDNHVYNLSFNELFLINPREWHYFSHLNEEDNHERFIIFIYPEFLKATSSPQTDLSYCFYYSNSVSLHSKGLSVKEKERFLYYIKKLSSPKH